MTKLTKAQISVLDRMRAGDEVWTTSGRKPSAFWHSNLIDKPPGWSTLHVLERRGLIRNYAPDFTGRKYAVTLTGLEALRTNGADNDKA